MGRGRREGGGGVGGGRKEGRKGKESIIFLDLIAWMSLRTAQLNYFRTAHKPPRDDFSSVISSGQAAGSLHCHFRSN